MSLPIDELKNRLKQALSIRNMKPIELSEQTGIPKSAISQYTSGYAKPKQDRIYLICKALDINEAWLMGYDVPMKKFSNAPNELPKILNYYNNLNNIGKQEATKRVEELSHIPKYTEKITLMAAHNDHADDPEELEKIYEDIMNLKRPEQ